MYTVKLLSNEEYDSLPYKRSRTSLGCADPKTKTAYVRKTGFDLFDLGTIQHEIDELVAKVSPHEEDGIRYKDDEEPEFNAPPAPKYKTADQLFSESINFGKSNYPMAYGARESALSDINNPAYYEKFQPTSFENALANQYFSNIWPEVQRKTLHGLSLAGIESSPITAELMGKQFGQLATPIGEFLANMGNQRATNSLQARLGIDPQGTYTNFLNVNYPQSNMQTQADFDYAMMKAQLDYQNAQNEYKQKQAGISGMFGLGGAGIGGLLAGALAIPTGGLSLAALPAVLGAAGSGAAFGSSLGGMAAPLFGGTSGGGMGIQDALSIANYFSPVKTGQAQNVGLGGGMPDIGSLFSLGSMQGGKYTTMPNPFLP